MAIRNDGDIQPGIQWLGFTLRIPFIHMKGQWPELIQGLLIAGSTGLALVPILTGHFGLNFEEAVAISVIHSVLICSSWLFFGEPYAPGWVTPALPFVLTFVISESLPTPNLRFQMMTALAIDFSLILAFLGLTGLGAKLIKVIPNVLKGAIIFGAAIAAFINVFDIGNESNVLHKQPFTIVTSIGISLLLAFSAMIKKQQKHYKWIAVIVSLGLLPGFVVGTITGIITSELNFNIQSGWVLLPFDTLWAKVTPFNIGWPPVTFFAEALPLAFITYVIAFGDIITGEAVIKDAEAYRPDEKLDINHNRTHLSLSIRNGLMGIFGPFFPSQGILWTGIHVILIERWKSGKGYMNSYFDGISSYYFFGVPIFFFYLPLITGLQPLMPMALAITLALTGFACGYVGMSKAKDATEQGTIVLSGMCLALFEPWIGLTIAVLASFLLIGRESNTNQG